MLARVLLVEVGGFLLSLVRYYSPDLTGAGLHLLSASCGACAPGAPHLMTDDGERKRQEQNYFVSSEMWSAHRWSVERISSM
jgi:hypothetical protein